MSLVLNATVVDVPRDAPTFTDADMARLAFLSRYNGKTFETYEQHLRAWYAWCEAMKLDVLQVRREHIELWLRDMELNGYRRKPGGSVRHYSKRTLNARLTTVAGLYKFAHIDGRTQSNPAAYVRRPKVYDEDRPPLDSNDMRRLVAAAERAGGDRYILILLLALSGLRVSEACSIDIDQIGEENGHRIIRNIVRKGGKIVTVPLSPTATRAVDRHIGERKTGPLLRRQSGTRLERATAYRWVVRLAEKERIPMHIHPHLLRAAFISEALAAQIPLPDVQYAASHADPRTTLKYDRRKRNMDAHPTYIVSARLAGG